MADVFPNLSDATVVAAVKNLSIYTSTGELEGLLRTLDAVAADVDSSIPAATTTTIGGVKKTTAITTLTNSSGGTSGGNTIAAVPLPAAAATGADTTTLPTQASVLASNTALRNAVATLAAKQIEIIAALKAAGIMS
ncbi:capsid decoration protein [Stenotrophomonas phage StenR_269]|nr:capsid decoration protein [Stenotrophomonas phage StenR_269]